MSTRIPSWFKNNNLHRSTAIWLMELTDQSTTMNISNMLANRSCNNATTNETTQQVASAVVSSADGGWSTISIIVIIVVIPTFNNATISNHEYETKLVQQAATTNNNQHRATVIWGSIDALMSTRKPSCNLHRATAIWSIYRICCPIDRATTQQYIE